MRKSLRRGFVLTAIAGTCVFAIAPAALAAPTASPEAIGLYASGTGLLPITVANTPDQTAVGTTSTATATVTGVLTASALTATVTSQNYSDAGVASLGTNGLTPLLGTLSANAIHTYCVFSAAGDFSKSYVTVANLSILGAATVNGTITSPTTLTLGSLPAGLATATVTLDQQVAGPVSGSETINGVVISYTLAGGLTSETIVITSATCGPFNASQVTPLASGKGLGIGLGLLGLLGAGIATIYVRRRRIPAAA